MTPQEKVIQVAQAEVGYLEKASDKDLDHKTANAGTQNHTKYARDLDALGTYYGKKCGYAWCDVFVDWCFAAAFGWETAMRMLNQGKGSYGAGCTASANYYKAVGRFHATGPQIGDQIFFTADGGKTANHTGLVVDVRGGKVHTIEGNTSGASGVVANGGGVCAKSYTITYKRIFGYGRPDWSLVTETEGKSVNKTYVAIPLASIERVRIVLGNKRTMAAVKAAEGCDYIINGGLYMMANNQPVCHLKADGAVLATDPYTYMGYAWDNGPDMVEVAVPSADSSAKANYIACVNLLGQTIKVGEKQLYDASLGGVRGRTAIALTGDKLILYTTKDGSSAASTPEALQRELYNMGAVSALMLDSGGSSQCDFGELGQVTSARNVHHYICVWLKKDGGPRYRVVTKTSPLTIRREPTTASENKGNYPKGTEVTVQAFKDGWARTDKGWCSLEFLEAIPEAQIPTPTPATTPTPEAPAPTTDKADDWAELAWGKAKAAGVLDGTRPRDSITRQELAVVLDRLGLLDNNKN